MRATYKAVFPPIQKIVMGLSLLLPALTAPADDAGSTPYFNVGAGVSLLQDFTAPSGIIATADPGLRLNLGGGYRLYSGNKIGVGLEAETGIIYNSMYAPGSFEGNVYQVPVLANVIFTLRPSSDLTPYVGVGGGAVYSLFDVDSRDASIIKGIRSPRNDIGGAVQGLAGLRYKFKEASEWELGYKYLSAFPSRVGRIENHFFGLSYSRKF